MFSGISTYWQNKVLDATYRGQALPNNGTLYVGLLTSTQTSLSRSAWYYQGETVPVLASDGDYHLYLCTTTGITAPTAPTYSGSAEEMINDGTAQFVEQFNNLNKNLATSEPASSYGYVRVPLVTSLANMSGTQGSGSALASNGVGGLTSNNIQITFNASSAAWAGKVWGAAVFDASTGGNLIQWGAFSAPLAVGSGVEISFNPATLSISIATVSTPAPVLSPATVVNQLLNLLPWKVWTGKQIVTPPSTTGNTYYVSPTGSDTNTGTSTTSAWATPQHAVNQVHAGDTVLFMGGTYRSGLNIVGGGYEGKPITYGCYGDGEVILDMTPTFSGWTQVSGTVYQLTTSFVPQAVVLNGSLLRPAPPNYLTASAIVTGGGGYSVNDVLTIPSGNTTAATLTVTSVASGGVITGTTISNAGTYYSNINALLNPVSPTGGTGTGAKFNLTWQGLSTVVSGSNLWYYDGYTWTMDFGSNSPSTATITAPSNTNPTCIYWYGNYMIFDGLTLMGSNQSGAWGYGSNIIVQNCKCMYNMKQGILFEGSTVFSTSNNQALYNLCYYNSLINWPRGSNGYAYSFGGWPGGAVGFAFAYKGTGRGNIAIGNGGESLISYGSGFLYRTGSTLYEQNLVMDGWSSNMYFDNQSDGIARQNILYYHVADPTTEWLIQPSAGYPWNHMYDIEGGISISDEGGSGAYYTAHNRNTQLYNNLIIGYENGIADYWETTAEAAQFPVYRHGLKNALIANNTIILPPTAPPGVATLGFHFVNNVSNGGSIGTFSYTPGSGYTDGTYTNVDLTGGGTPAKINVTISGGAVTACAISFGGLAYQVGQVLNAYLAGSGTGFTLTVESLSGAQGAFSSLVGGSGYVVGNYTNVPLTGGSGSQLAVDVTVSDIAASASVAASGTGYSVGQVLTLIGGTYITAASLTVTSVSGGAITGVSVSTPGEYTALPANPVAVNSGAATFNVTWTSGVVTALTHTNPASGYAVGDVLYVVGGTATLPASVTVTQVDQNGSINQTVVNSNLSAVSSIVVGGTGYVVGDVLDISGMYSTPATLNVTSVGAGGVITGVSIANNGVYSLLPPNTVVTTGGKGTGAVFSVTWVYGQYSVEPSNPIAFTGGSSTGYTINGYWSSGSLTSMGPTAPGEAYLLGDVLSVSNANLGGTGSGFSVTISEIAPIVAINYNSRVYNNVVIGNDNTMSNVWFEGFGANPGVTTDYNVHWNPAATAVFQVGYDTVNTYNFAQWQAATGNDANGFFIDPQFPNYTTNVSNLNVQSSLPSFGDYTVTNPSIIGKGIALPDFSTDLIGNIRQVWTPGCIA